MATVLCSGIAVLDFVYGVAAMPTKPEKHRASALEVVGGGIAANAAVAIARLGGAASLMTRLGDDATGDAIRAELTAEGVDLSLSPAIAGRRSPNSAILVDPAGERLIVSYADPDMPARPDWLPAALPAGVGAGAGADAGVGAVLCDTRWEEAAAHLFALARAAGIPAVLDGDRKPLIADNLALPTHIAFSEQGLTELTGLADPAAALRRFAESQSEGQSGRPAWLAVTCGAGGVFIWDRGRTSHVPAFAVTAVDTLGAGDVWHGAFTLALAEGQAETAAVRFANAAAAIKCTRFGGRKGAPTRAEVDAFLRSHP
jgi:sulfofructose kinase